MRAAFREGIGCVILAPDQTFADIESLPIQSLAPLEGDPATIAWPNGDLLDGTLPTGVDWSALTAASDWAFERESPEQVTLSLIVIHDGRIIHERYADGFDITTRTRTWSTAKSIAVVKRSRPPHIVASQLRIFTPVGTAMNIVDNEKAATEIGPMPETNMWWAHTPQPMKPIAIPEKTMNE